MGVMPCQRNGCGNIMCDRYSYTHGYICEDCFQDLVDLGENVDIDRFMAEPFYEKIKLSSFEKWDKEFKLR